MNFSSERRWLEVHQVANRLKVANDTVYRLVDRKELPALRFAAKPKPGRRKKLITRIAEDDLDRFIRGNYS